MSCHAGAPCVGTSLLAGEVEIQHVAVVVEDLLQLIFELDHARHERRDAAPHVVQVLDAQSLLFPLHPAMPVAQRPGCACIVTADDT